MPFRANAAPPETRESSWGRGRIPARLLRAVHRAEDDDCVKRVGIHWATEQIRDLLDNRVRGIQFFTLNSSTATREIYSSLGVRDSSRLRVA